MVNANLIIYIYVRTIELYCLISYDSNLNTVVKTTRIRRL